MQDSSPRESANTMHLATWSAALLGTLVAGLVVATPGWTSSAEAGPEKSRQVTVQGKSYTLWEGWHDNGKRWYRHYWRNDKKQLVHKDWNEQGVLVQQVTWKNDIRHGPARYWHDDGVLAEEVTYREGKRHGAYKKYFASGKPEIVATYHLDEPTGPYRVYHATGGIRFEGRFRKGQPDGGWISRDPSGATLERADFRDGKRVPALARRTPLSTQGLIGGDDFSFVMVRGSGLEGYDFVLKVAADGRARFITFTMVEQVYRGPKTDGLRRGETYLEQRFEISDFRLSEAHQRALRDKLAAIDVMSLDKLYNNPDIEDGTQWHVAVRSRGKSKKIDCSNKFPSQLKELARFLDKDILPHHAFDRLTAFRTRDGDASRDWSWL